MRDAEAKARLLFDELARANETAEEWRLETLRLRALIKAGEWGDQMGNSSSCPWCSVDRDSRHGEHYDECRAFTSDGQVR